MGKNPPANAGDEGFDPRLGKIPWRRKWQSAPVCLENSMNRGAWQTTVHGGVIKSQTQLSDRVSHMHAGNYYRCKLMGCVVNIHYWWGFRFFKNKGITFLK